MKNKPIALGQCLTFTHNRNPKKKRQNSIEEMLEEKMSKNSLKVMADAKVLREKQGG